MKSKKEELTNQNTITAVKRINKNVTSAYHTPGNQPAGQTLLRLQQTIGNRETGNLILQLQDKPEADFTTINWDAGVKLAQETAKKDRGKAEEYYKQLIVRAAQKVQAQAPLQDRKPELKDIRWGWSVGRDAAAIMDATLIDNHPDDYWKWIKFSPSMVLGEAWTQSVILHELNHAAYAKSLFLQWQSNKRGQKWDDYWNDHFQKWVEQPIKIPDVGVLGVLEGLPEQIRPSAIELSAYVDQFVNYFHKYPLKDQGTIVKAIVLFYPSPPQKQKEMAEIIKARDQARDAVLAYFNQPPVSDPEQQQIIKTRIAREFSGAMLFRPSEGNAVNITEQIKKDFQAIFDFRSTLEREDILDAGKKYKPQK